MGEPQYVIGQKYLVRQPHDSAGIHGTKTLIYKGVDADGKDWFTDADGKGKYHPKPYRIVGVVQEDEAATAS